MKDYQDISDKLKKIEREESIAEDRLSDTIYLNRKTFHKAFKDFLWSSERLELLPDCGWNDGGCRSLMCAMQSWLGNEVKTYQIVMDKKEGHSEHVVSKIGRYYVDGDGISLHNTLYKRWRYNEKFPHVFIRPFDPKTEAHSRFGDLPYYIEKEKIHQLRSMLEETFDKRKVLELLLREKKEKE